MYSVLYIHRAVNSELCRGILGVAVEETAHLLLGGNACFVEWRQHKELLLAVCDGESETNATQTEIKKPRKTARLLLGDFLFIRLDPSHSLRSSSMSFGLMIGVSIDTNFVYPHMEHSIFCIVPSRPAKTKKWFW